MRKQYLFFSIFVLSSLFGFGQVGFLGKRVHFQFESKFTPAWSNLNFNHKQGIFCFNYNLMPSVEYIFAEKWSVGVHYQYATSAFKIDKLDDDNTDIFSVLNKGYFFGNENRYKGYSEGEMTIHGCGVSFLRYFSNCAPAGYYIKFGVDAFFYNASVPYTGYDTLVVTQTDPYSTEEEYVYKHKPGTYTKQDWAMGLRFEIGRNFFIGRYISLGTSLSCGILFKGWGNLIYNANPQFIDMANKRLLTSYIGGISIKVGILPF